MFPHGVVYEGVSEEPMSFRGESGANDSMERFQQLFDLPRDAKGRQIPLCVTTFWKSKCRTLLLPRSLLIFVPIAQGIIESSWSGLKIEPMTLD